MNRFRRMLFRLKLEIWYRWSKWRHRNTEIVIDPDIDLQKEYEPIENEPFSVMYSDDDDFDEEDIDEDDYYDNDHFDDWPW